MTDPVTNVEIEDVLSAIRRLVTEDLKTKNAGAGRVSSERLVLTPAQRVTQQRPAETEGQVDDDMPPTPDLPSEKPADPVAASVPARVPDAKAGDTGAAGAKAASLIEEEVANAVREYFGGADRSEKNEEAAPTVTVTDDAPEADVGGQDKTLETKIARLEQMIGRSGDAWDPASADAEEAETSPPVAPMPWQDKVEASDNAVALSGHDEAPEASDSTAAPEADNNIDMTDTFIYGTPKQTAQENTSASSALHTVAPDAEDNVLRSKTWETPLFMRRAAPAENHNVAEDDEQSDPVPADDVAPVDQMVEDAVSDITTAPAIVTSAPEPLMPEAAEEEGAAPSDEEQLAAPVMTQDSVTKDDAPLIDEETLRVMVADIVRVELQGALGERITRSVRKLVRREIHRALLTQDID